MKWLIIMLLISTPCYACVEVVSKDIQYVNEASKTVAVKAGGVVQNKCGYTVRHVEVQVVTLDENGNPRHAFQEEIMYQMEPGELREFNLEGRVRHNVDNGFVRVTFKPHR